MRRCLIIDPSRVGRLIDSVKCRCLLRPEAWRNCVEKKPINSSMKSATCITICACERACVFIQRCRRRLCMIRPIHANINCLLPTGYWQRLSFCFLRVVSLYLLCYVSLSVWRRYVPITRAGKLSVKISCTSWIFLFMPISENFIEILLKTLSEFF